MPTTDPATPLLALPASEADPSALRYLAGEVPHLTLPGYLGDASLPALCAAGGTPLPGLAQRGFLRHMARTALLADDPLGPALRAALDADRAGELAWSVLLRWQQAGMPWVDRWCLAALGPWGLARHAPLLAAEIPRWQRGKRGIHAALGIEVLRRMNTTPSLRALRGFALGTRWRTLSEVATAQWDEAARARGLSPGDLEDLVLYEATPDEAEVDEADRGTLARLRSRALEQAMTAGRRWPAAAWWRWVKGSREAAGMASLLVWSIYIGGRRVATARLAEGRLVRASGAPVAAAPGAEVGLLHPVELRASSRERWRRALRAAGVAPPFPQLEREIPAGPAPVHDRVERPFGAITVSPSWLHGHLRRRGWDHTDPEDNGNVLGCYKAHAAHDLTVLVRAGGSWVGGPYDFPAPIEIVFLRGLHTRSSLGWSYGWPALLGRCSLALGEVPIVLHAEALRDVRLVVDRAARGAGSSI
jgi:hypothetical protein